MAKKVICYHLESVAAGTADVLGLCHGLPGEWLLADAYYMPATTDAADAGNYTSITLKNGAGGTACATALTNATVAFTVGTARQITITAGTIAEFGTTDCLEIDKAETGTGGIMHGALTLVWEDLRV